MLRNIQRGNEKKRSARTIVPFICIVLSILLISRGSAIAIAQEPVPVPTIVPDPWSSEQPPEAPAGSFGVMGGPTTLGGIPWTYDPQPPRSLSAAEIKSFEDQVNDLINQKRISLGLYPLTSNPKLAQSAEGFSQYLATCNCEVSHFGPNNMSPYDRMAAAGYRVDRGGEVVAAGQSTPQQVVQAWLDSSSHRPIILGSYGEDGVGYVEVPGSVYRYYWTVDFGGSPGCCGGVNPMPPTPIPFPTYTFPPTPIPFPTYAFPTPISPFKTPIPFPTGIPYATPTVPRATPTQQAGSTGFQIVIQCNFNGQCGAPIFTFR